MSDTKQTDEIAKTPAAAKPAAPKVDFVRMIKDGAVTEVHPTTVESHKAAGWKLAG